MDNAKSSFRFVHSIPGIADAGMGEEGGKEQGRPRAEDEKERRKDERRREQAVEKKNRL